MALPPSIEALLERDRRVLVHGLTSCLRLLLPGLEASEPSNRDVLEAIEMWTRSELEDEDLARTFSRAQRYRGAWPLCRCIDIANASPADLPAMVEKLILEIAMSVWRTQNEAGRAWCNDPKNRSTHFEKDPFAWNGILACREELWARMQRAAGERPAIPSDPCVPPFGRGTFLEEIERLRLWIVETHAEVRPNDALMVGGRECVIDAVDVLRSPIDPPPPRRVALRLRERIQAPHPCEAVAFVRRAT